MLRVDRAARADRESVCALDAAVLGDSSRRAGISAAVEDGRCLVANDDDGLVGFAIWDLSFYGNGFVSLLIVRPDRRRSGAGRALMRRVEELCPTEKLFTSTNESNVPMRRLCASLGFAESGRIENLDEDDPEVVYFKKVDRRR